MNEQEVKEIIEKVVQLEIESEGLISIDDFGGAGARTREAGIYETRLEEAGFTLGNDGEDVIVYQRIGTSWVSEEWLRFDTANWQWKEVQE